MFVQDPDVVATAIREHWDLPGPILLHDTLVRGVTADVWLVTTGPDQRHVAKFVYDDRAVVEAGLAISEEVQRRTGIPTGAPRRTRTGNLTVMLPSVPGQQHPLALLAHLDGATGPFAPEACADLLAEVHAVPLRIPAPDGLFSYLEDESAPIAWPDELLPLIRGAVQRVRELPDLTWGTCYGDTPEIVALPAGNLGLIDWGSVVRGPLMWDVACWALEFAADPDRQRFVDRYLARGLLPAAEVAQVERFVDLRRAQLLRFLAYRVLRADHYAPTASADVAELARIAAQFGVSIGSR